MVLYDFSPQPLPGSGPKPPRGFAPLQHRIIASFVDIMILYPLVYLLISPVVRSLQQSFYYGSAVSLGASIVAAFFLGSLVTLLLLALSNYYLRGTPGQRLFHLRLRSAASDEVGIAQAFQRSFGWMVSFLWFGFPLFEALTHKQRLVFYERMSETYLETTERHWGRPAPAEVEIQFGRWVIVSSVVFAFFFFSLLTTAWMRSQYRQAAVLAFDGGALCKEITLDVIDREKRLQIALLLNYLDPEQTDCFETEMVTSWSKDAPAAENENTPSEQTAIFHLLNIAEMTGAEYIDQFCTPEQSQGQACLLTKYLSHGKKSKRLNPNQVLEVVDGLRALPNKHLLTEWIILQEDLKANHFLAASKRLENIETYLDGSTDIMSARVDQKYIQLAWQARTKLEADRIALKSTESIPEKPTEGSVAKSTSDVESESDFNDSSNEPSRRTEASTGSGRRPASTRQLAIDQDAQEFIKLFEDRFELVD